MYRYMSQLVASVLLLEVSAIGIGIAKKKKVWESLILIQLFFIYFFGHLIQLFFGKQFS